MNDSEKKCFTVDVRKLALGIFYLLLIAVVVYGMGDHVYDGFGKCVPWVIMILFAAMGIMRIAEAITGKVVIEWLRDIDIMKLSDGENEQD